MAPTFMGGSLKLKGAKKKKKKTKHSKLDDIETKTKIDDVAKSSDENDEELTAAEKISLRRKKERETLELEKTAKQSHRERIEEFNEKLGKLTELNDIPRVSAAGNG